MSGRDPLERDEPLDLREILAILRRQRWVIAGVTALTLLTAVVLTALQDRVYVSEAQVVVEPFGSGTVEDVLGELLLGRSALTTQREIATSLPVAERAAERLGSGDPEALLGRIRVDVVQDTNVLRFRGTGPTPEQARDLTDAFVEAYLAFRREDALQRLLDARQELQARTAELRDRIEEIDGQLEATTDPATADALRQERQSLLTQLGELSAQAAALDVSDAFVRGGGQVIRPATLPEAPSSPRPYRNAALAVVLGGLLGTGVGLLREQLDDRLRSDEEAARIADAAVLGHIPHWEVAGPADRLPTRDHPRGVPSEAFRTLRTNVRFVAATRATRLLVVTSPGAAAGKTTVACNLAVAAAQAGQRVLLIDADMRHPDVHTVLGTSRDPGLSELLIGEGELRARIRDVGIPNLRVLPTGAPPPNPAELLGSPQARALLDSARSAADLVVIDSPPVLAVADPLELARAADGVLLVVNAARTGRGELRSAVQRLRAVDADIVGLVINDLRRESATYYGTYAYHYYPYGADGDGAPAGRRGAAQSSPTPGDTGR